jgi:hypothetical protein
MVNANAAVKNAPTGYSRLLNRSREPGTSSLDSAHRDRRLAMQQAHFDNQRHAIIEDDIAVIVRCDCLHTAERHAVGEVMRRRKLSRIHLMRLGKVAQIVILVVAKT